MSVRDHDERWDELALGHVLGGLASADASSFRTHLAACDQCRARVAELRSLDSEMAAAAREERATRREREARLAPARTDDRSTSPAPTDRREPRPPAWRPRWRTVIALAVTALLLGGLSFWNAHLRTQNAYLTQLAEAQDEALGVFGQGTVVPVTTAGDVSGTVAVDGDRVAYALSGVPTPAVGQRLVVWLRDAQGVRAVDDRPPGAMADGVLRSTVQAVDAEGLHITLEPDPAPAAPSGRVVLEADLPGAPPAAPTS